MFISTLRRTFTLTMLLALCAALFISVAVSSAALTGVFAGDLSLITDGAIQTIMGVGAAALVALQRLKPVFISAL